MKYRMGTQSATLSELDLHKIRLVRDGFVECIWVKQGPDYVVLQNNALAFLPFHSWGAVLPSRNPSGADHETIDVSHLVPADGLELHPEAWTAFVEKGVIASDGEWLDPDEP